MTLRARDKFPGAYAQLTDMIYLVHQFFNPTTNCI